MAELRKIAIRSTDFPVALDFLTTALGLPTKFASDGYAELVASLGVALLSADDYPAGAHGEIALMVKVDAVDAALELLTAAGARPLGDVEVGAHEFRAAVELPGSAAVAIVYGAER